MNQSLKSQTLETLDLYPSRQNSKPLILDRKDPIFFSPREDDSPSSTPLSSRQIQSYISKGFLFFPGLFSQAEILQINQEVAQLEQYPENLKKKEYILEPESGELRSIFDVHRNKEVFKKIAKDFRLLVRIRQILDSDVYIHQSRINRKPGFLGKEFYWHSDFETWHQEDGMPRMRAVSCSIFLSENTLHNGPTMVMPGSHQKFISCVGETPERHYLKSLRRQEYGVPDAKFLEDFDKESGIEAPIGPAGSVLLFDCNLLHGSNGNITPRSRSNMFLVYNSLYNRLQAPFSGQSPRPEYIASRNFTPVEFL